MDFNINIFTLNCWGIPIVSKNRKERMEAIAKYLKASNHDVACLQEIWSESDYLYFKDQLKTTFLYSHYFYSGVLGSGLCVFSKWLIQDVFFHQWALNGYIHKIHHGDWFGGKGVGLCRIKHNNRLINIYCTHLHAEYHEDDIYLAHRVLQAYSTGEFVNLTSAPADIFILAGDLNTAPGDLSFRLLTAIPSLIDPYDLDCKASDPNIAKATGTCDNINNSYSDQKLAQKCPEGKRIDHILFNVNHNLKVEVVNFGNPLKDRVPDQPFSYSDHNAVTLELRVSAAKECVPLQKQLSKELRYDKVIAEAITVCEEARKTILKSKRVFLLSGGMLFMLLLGTVGFWPNYLLYDIAKIILTGLCFYYIIMGTLWHRIEMNSLKAGLSALENFQKTRNENKDILRDAL